MERGKKEEDFERLPDEVFPEGTGVHGLSARLIKRQGKLCMYERSDHVFEVFIVKIQKACEMFGRTYPKKEVYPSNESFGVNAWCYNDKKEAEKKFTRLLEWNMV